MVFKSKLHEKISWHKKGKEIKGFVFWWFHLLLRIQLWCINTHTRFIQGIKGHLTVIMS